MQRSLFFFVAGVCLNLCRFFFFLSFSFLFQGRIACANVLSDLYAMGVTECDNMLMLLGVSNKMTDRVRFGVSASEEGPKQLYILRMYAALVFSPQTLNLFKEEVVQSLPQFEVQVLPHKLRLFAKTSVFCGSIVCCSFVIPTEMEFLLLFTVLQGRN